jgi:hypothetical protein
MKLVCKIEHVVLQIEDAHRLFLKNEVLEVADELAYALLTKYSHAIEKLEDSALKTKEIEKAEKVK